MDSNKVTSVLPIREDKMSHKSKPKRLTKHEVTIEEVNRVLEVGRLLFSILTEEEVAELQRILNSPLDENEIGNTGVT